MNAENFLPTQPRECALQQVLQFFRAYILSPVSLFSSHTFVSSNTRTAVRNFGEAAEGTNANKECAQLVHFLDQLIVKLENGTLLPPLPDVVEVFQSLCALESLAFLTDENLEILAIQKTHTKHIWQQWLHSSAEALPNTEGNSIEFFPYRTVTSLVVSQLEWQQEIQFSALSAHLKTSVLTESPAASIGILLN